jgi:hypothetical protein
VLDEVAKPVLFGLLMTGANIDPDADGDRTHMRHLLGDDPKPIGENGFRDFALLISGWLHTYLREGTKKKLDLRSGEGVQASF